jgi:hypothetical protein
MIRSNTWFKIFDVISEFAHSQENAQKMTDAVYATIKGNLKNA